MTRHAFLVNGVTRSVTKLTRERVRVAILASALICGDRLGTNGGSSSRRVVVVGTVVGSGIGSVTGGGTEMSSRKVSVSANGILNDVGSCSKMTESSLIFVT